MVYGYEHNDPILGPCPKEELQPGSPRGRRRALRGLSGGQGGRPARPGFQELHLAGALYHIYIYTQHTYIDIYIYKFTHIYIIHMYTHIIYIHIYIYIYYQNHHRYGGIQSLFRLSFGGGGRMDGWGYH